MKIQELKELELIELNSKEQKQIEGGFLQALALIAIAGIITDWSDFKKGFASGFAAGAR